MGTWYKNPVAHKMFYEMYKVSSELSLATINLQEIVKLQYFLKHQGIPYSFMSYVNYWNQEDNVSPNGDFGVLKYPELKYLIDQIDFKQWIFLNDNKDGIYEMAKNLQSFQQDQFHPGTEANLEWAKLITSRI